MLAMMSPATAAASIVIGVLVLFCTALVTMPRGVRGLSSSQSTSRFMASNALTDSAAQFVKDLSISQREKLLVDGALLQGRPIKIHAERLDHPHPPVSSSTMDAWTDNKNYGVVTKVVHFQRHGQGYHNLLGDVLRDVGIQLDIDSMDPTVNPWIRPEIVDSPLTEAGKWQCEKQRVVASTLCPELVVVSPLLRAIQTAKISFIDYFGNPNIPWIAHEGCREEMGVLTCNKRRPLSEIQADFPEITFHSSMTEEDTLWHPNERESNQSKGDRIYDFLANFLARRPERNIAVVGHSAWLFHLCNAIVDCGEDEDLKSWFLTSEVRSMKLTFINVDDTN